MNNKVLNLTYEVELQAGEKLSLPDSLLNNIGAGRWVVTVQPIPPEDSVAMLDHTAFLNGYAPEDEGLYDDYLTR
ncbi:MAG: hypothetical protein KME11_02835 [Timaviella obliquedivisa GSE-PSE-MK23-08B]|jgi:hypothetical protein|nr:hypothetical protein [Timaviella obliquedivisa GSE-PSE-MK23-08B]